MFLWRVGLCYGEGSGCFFTRILFLLPLAEPWKCFSWFFTMKIWCIFWRLNPPNLGPPKLSTSGVSHSQANPYSLQQFIKMTTEVFLHVYDSSRFSSKFSYDFWDSPVSSVFGVVVCPMTSVLWWVQEKSLFFSVCLTFFDCLFLCFFVCLFYFFSLL